MQCDAEHTARNMKPAYVCVCARASCFRPELTRAIGKGETHELKLSEGARLEACERKGVGCEGLRQMPRLSFIKAGFQRGIRGSL